MKNTLLCLLAIAIIAAPATSAGDVFKFLTGHEYIDGSGDLVTQTRDLKEFSRIKLKGSMDLFITVGKDQEVKLTYDDNLIDLIETEVRGKTLTIWCEESYSSSRGSRIDISVPSLETVDLSGSGDIEIHDLKGDIFEYSVAGSGDLTVGGKVDELEIKVSGSGDVDARELEAAEVYVRVSGSGDVRVFATESFDGRVSGSGDITFYGDPEHVSRHVSGSGDIRKKR